MKLPTLLLGLATGLIPTAASAQGTRATLVVEVRADGRPLEGAVVRASRIAAVSGADGLATLALAAGPHLVLISRIGYAPDTLSVTLAPGDTLRRRVTLTAVSVDLEQITVTATRVERRLEDEPVRVEVLGGEDVAEKTEMRPSDLTKLLSEVVGVRMQAGGGALGATRLRIQGLRGQYTGLLADGLPLYGGGAGGFGVLQLAPVDIKQAEVIKGTATALYGPSALGGLLNLVSRRPETNTYQVVANQSVEGGSDLMLWGARRATGPAGLTVFAEGHHQIERDVDADGWNEVPGFTRGAVRPRLFLDAPNGDALFATAGVMAEDRAGGFAPIAADPYREARTTRRVDAGMTGRRTVGTGGHVDVRLSAMHQWTRQNFGTVTERDRRSTLLAELSYTAISPLATFVVGSAWQRDALTNLDVSGFDYVFSAPAAFAQVTVAPARSVALSAIGRCDIHNVYGTYCSPRLGLLVKPVPALTARLSAGVGFFAPTPLTEESEVIGLHALVPSSLVPERARSASVDLTWRAEPLELSGTLARSRLLDPLALVPVAGDSLGREELINVPGPTDITAGELFAVVEAEPFVITAFYGYLHGTERDPESAARRETNLTPRHSFGADVALEGGGGWIAVETFYTGTQRVWDNPFRTTSRPYVVTEILVSQRFGAVRVYANVENLFDVRQTTTDPLLLPTPAVGGRRTVTPWGPTEGRILSAGVMLDW